MPGRWVPGLRGSLNTLEESSFASCLLVAPPDVGTLGFVRALHQGGFAVLERDPEHGALQLARTREFSVIAWFIDPRSSSSVLAVQQLTFEGIPVVAVLQPADPGLVAEILVAGAHACLELEADARVVVAQVRSVLRRAGRYDKAAAEVSGLLQVGDLTVDMDRCEVQRAGEFVGLTASEFRIVEYMARNNGRVLKPHEILNSVSSDYEYLPREAQDVFKVYVRRIRRKLEPNENEPSYLVTVRGFGYRLEGGRRSPVAGRTAITA